MNSRERVLAVLNGEIPDRVPWMENFISNEVTAGLLGHNDFVKATYSQKIDFPGMIRISPDIRRVIPLDNISYDLAPPRFAKTERLGGHDNITEGLIKTKADLKLLDTLPDPDDDALYKPAESYVTRYKEDAAAVITVRSGPGNTYLSMGIDHFCKSLITQPDLVEEILWRFGDWTKRVVQNVQELPFDLFFVPDDIGFGNAPMISPTHFRQYLVPVMKSVFDAMRLPIIYHSDGNIMPLMEDFIGLGVAGIANMEPGPMDIAAVKREYGDRVTLMGNIDLQYTLTQGTPEETRAEVRSRIETLAPGGRYILASANSLPNYVKPENAAAMGSALLDFGNYAKIAKMKVTPTSAQGAAASAPQPSEFSAEAPETEDHIYIIRRAVIDQDLSGIAAKVQTALAEGEDPERILNESLIPAMDDVGRRFTENKIFVPEMLVSAQTMKSAVDTVKPLLQEGKNTASKGTVILVSVKGDLHDIGKNIVAMMLEGGGFEVADLGVNVDETRIVEAVRTQRPHILGLSALLTTTLSEMKKVIEALKQAGLRETVKVIVGGAPVTKALADDIGADGYGADAAKAVSVCKSLMAAES